jgi:hypothetical protein
MGPFFNPEECRDTKNKLFKFAITISSKETERKHNAIVIQSLFRKFEREFTNMEKAEELQFTLGAIRAVANSFDLNENEKLAKIRFILNGEQQREDNKKRKDSPLF